MFSKVIKFSFYSGTERHWFEVIFTYFPFYIRKWGFIVINNIINPLSNFITYLLQRICIINVTGYITVKTP